MLARTGADVDSDVELFKAADVFLFCSAVTSRKMMDADPMNIACCSHVIFVADKGDEVLVGFRKYPDGAMQEVQAPLDGIATEAVGQKDACLRLCRP